MTTGLPRKLFSELCVGAIVDKMKILVNSDFHEFQFAGPAQDLIDSVSFRSGQGKLTEFPDEPDLDSFDYSIVPGHMGQAWLGVTPERFYTLTAAELSLDNCRCAETGVRIKQYPMRCAGVAECKSRFRAVWHRTRKARERCMRPREATIADIRHVPTWASKRASCSERI